MHHFVSTSNISLKGPYIKVKQLKEIINIPITHSLDSIYCRQISKFCQLERDDIIRITCRKICHVLMNLELGRKISAYIEELLEKVCNENPLDPKINNKNTEVVELNLKTREVKLKPMNYTKQDRDEFAENIKQMCDMGLIRPTKSKHSALAF